MNQQFFIAFFLTILGKGAAMTCGILGHTFQDTHDWLFNREIYCAFGGYQNFLRTFKFEYYDIEIASFIS